MPLFPLRPGSLLKTVLRVLILVFGIAVLTWIFHRFRMKVI